jgi:hypothetical protein
MGVTGGARRAMKPKRLARALRVVAVHVVTDGFDLGPSGPAVRAELAAKAPDVYRRETPLRSIRARLSPETRAAIEAAWELETKGAPLRAARRRTSQGAPSLAPAGSGGNQ